MLYHFKIVRLTVSVTAKYAQNMEICPNNIRGRRLATYQTHNKSYIHLRQNEKRMYIFMDTHMIQFSGIYVLWRIYMETIYLFMTIYMIQIHLRFCSNFHLKFL